MPTAQWRCSEPPSPICSAAPISARSSLTPGKYTVGAAFDGNDSYAASATAGTLTLGVQPTGLDDDDPPVIKLFLPSVESQ